MSGRKKILIVGGTGFIGLSVTKEAISRGFSVTVLSKNKTYLSDRLDRVEYITADIVLKEELFNKLNGKFFQYVVNLSGYINHSDFSNEGDSVFDVHFSGVRNLVNCLNKAHLVSFIQIGSSDEYGMNTAPQNENQREDPISPYSLAKVASTHFLQVLHKTEKFPAIILRPFLVYGPGQGTSRFIPQIIEGCPKDEKFPVSKGDQIRDFCYIGDFVEAIFVSIKNYIVCFI